MYKAIVVAIFTIAAIVSCNKSTAPDDDPIIVHPDEMIIDHTYVNVTSIPDEYITAARNNLHIMYGHTSHGSQLMDGMTGLMGWKAGYDTKYAFSSTQTSGVLHIVDGGFQYNDGGSQASDLGNPNFTAWETATRRYLTAHTEINVVMWSWCGQVSDASEDTIANYLSLMNGLENDYPNVTFVYMTGHLDGTGTTENLNQRNEQIRTYCNTYNKVLYDFADIESYDPDMNEYLSKNANDNCDYDSDGNGSLDKNWATTWQTAHPGEWYDCLCAHSQPLNGNKKAFAAWALFARIAGWNP